MPRFCGEIIGSFDALNRALMILYLDDRSYSEIAEILGITQTNVATKINRLKGQLRRSVAAQAVP
jgi:DNA-directed RNA polymerase specialized sigma24 family protein